MGARHYGFDSLGERGRTPGRQGRGRATGDVGRMDGAQGMRQRLVRLNLQLQRRRRCTADHAQRAVQRVAGRSRRTVIAGHQLDRTASGTDQLHGLRLDDRRSDGHAEREREPHQHEAGKEVGAAQSLHALDYDSPASRQSTENETTQPRNAVEAGTRRGRSLLLKKSSVGILWASGRGECRLRNVLPRKPF